LGRLHGWGIDVPLVVGYESEGGLYLLWLGGRIGGEHIDLHSPETGLSAGGLGGTSVSLSGTRLWGGALLGLAVGFRHLHVGMELDVSYASIAGDFNAVHVQIRGLTVAPATAIWWRF
ncbi:MAG: hypothetical protein M3O50_20240, partial [Myxococcota bacterium]|nr:hypothetical protein [Myxococcota bacterium]